MVTQFSLTEREKEQAGELSQNMEELLNGEEGLTLRLSHRNGRCVEVVVSSQTLRLLADFLAVLAEGQEVLLPQGAELTTQEAAHILGVSRPYVVRLLEEGRIPFRKIGTHRRVRVQDLQVFACRDREERMRGVQELTELNESLGLYDTF